MNINSESRELIKSHMKMRYGWDMQTEDVHEMPYQLQVWEWWRALAYFKMDNWYESLTDATPNQPWISVMESSVKQYRWKEDRYIYIQEITKEICMKVYDPED